MDRISLRYCESASDKTYQAEIVPVSDGFQVNFAYGLFHHAIEPVLHFHFVRSVQIHPMGRKHAAC